MKKTIINFTILLLIILISGLYVYKSITSFVIDIPDIVKPKVFIKKEIQIKGKVIVKDKPVPYIITLKEYEADEWKFEPDLSLLPDTMTVDSVTTNKKFDFLAPARVGYSVNNIEEYRPTLAYNPIRYKSIEIGIITDFKSVGIDLGVKYRNIGLNGYYMANKTYGVGLMVKVF